MTHPLAVRRGAPFHRRVTGASRPTGRCSGRRRVPPSTSRCIPSTGGEPLGDLIWWSLAEARINRTDLENIWAGAQLLPSFLPEPPTAEKALKAAGPRATVGHPDRLIRLGLENEAEIVFAGTQSRPWTTLRLRRPNAPRPARSRSRWRHA